MAIAAEEVINDEEDVDVDAAQMMMMGGGGCQSACSCRQRCQMVWW